MIFSCRWHQSILEIPELIWEEVVGQSVNPFFSWKWLLALEESGSVSKRTGWQPLFLSIWRGSRLVGIAPLYLKSHSFGEFIFDDIFVRLAQDLSLNYYPKLIGMSPFSPVEGYRFFIKPEEDASYLTELMMHAIHEFALSNKILSCNFLYVDPAWSEIAESCGFSSWYNKRSIWERGNHRDFSDYLLGFNANQRRNIKRERKTVDKSGLQIASLTGVDINSSILQKIYSLYSSHCARWGIWGSNYLDATFFDSLAESSLRESLIIFSAFRTTVDDPVAMSLCLKHGDKLWGRYWGSREEIDCLHFELCYYSPINWCFQNAINTFDPGAGGSHKQRRGFAPIHVTSLHRWYDNNMNELIRSWLPIANREMLLKIESENKEMPFRG